MRFTPPATAKSHSPRRRLWHARWIATSDAEHAVSTTSSAPADRGGRTGGRRSRSGSRPSPHRHRCVPGRRRVRGSSRCSYAEKDARRTSLEPVRCDACVLKRLPRHLEDETLLGSMLAARVARSRRTPHRTGPRHPGSARSCPHRAGPVGIGSKSASASQRSEGMSVIVSTPSRSTRHKDSPSCTPPGRRQPRPTMASGPRAAPSASASRRRNSRISSNARLVAESSSRACRIGGVTRRHPHRVRAAAGPRRLPRTARAPRRHRPSYAPAPRRQRREQSCADVPSAPAKTDGQRAASPGVGG